MEQGFMERFHLNRKKLAIIISAIFIVIAAIIAAIIINQSKIVAVSMRIFRMVGTVNLYDNGREQSMKEKMRLKSGHSLRTAEESLVMISLDEIKLFTMEESSRARVIPARNRLEYKLEEGSLYFNVTEKLAEDENFEITTNTMICGIRGTSGFVGLDATGHETLMVTDGIVHVTATNPVTKEITEVDVAAGEMITIYLDDEAEGDATISITKKKFREEDLPALALDAIAKSPELMDRIFNATGFFSDKITELARLSSTPGISMYGQAVKELNKAGIDDSIPFMGEVSDSMVLAANNAVDIAQDDLALEVAILTGTKDVHDNGYDNGYRGATLAIIMDSAMKCVDDSLVSAKEEGLSNEDLRTLAETLADTLDNATEKMTVAGLDSKEISNVIDAIGTVIADAIETGAENGDILSAVADASSFVKNTVTAEMIKDSNGAETVAALLGKDSIAVADLGESNASGNDASSDNSTNVSGNGNGNTGNGTQGGNNGNYGASGNGGNTTDGGNGSGDGSGNNNNDNGNNNGNNNNNNGNNNSNNNGDNNNNNNGDNNNNNNTDDNSNNNNNDNSDSNNINNESENNSNNENNTNNENNNGSSNNNGTSGNNGGNNGGNSGGNSGGNTSGNNDPGTVTVPASGSNVASSVQTALNTAGTDKVVITKDDNNNGNVSIGDNVTVPNGKSLEIGDGVTMNVASGSDINVAQGGTLTSYGTIENYGTFVNEGTIQNFCNESIHNHGIFINLVDGVIDNGDGEEEHKGRFINYEDGIVGNRGNIHVDDAGGSSFVNYGIISGSIKSMDGEDYTVDAGQSNLNHDVSTTTRDDQAAFCALVDNDTKLILFGVGSAGDFNVSNVLYWLNNDGYGNTTIKTVEVKEGITEIGECIFQAFLALEEVTLPESLEEIGMGAFQQCTALKKINIPSKIRSLPTNVFSGCSSLEQVDFAEPKNLRYINLGAFGACRSLETLPFDEMTSLRGIGVEAFGNCTKLKDVVFNDGLEEICMGAFHNCTSIEKIEIPDSVVILGTSPDQHWIDHPANATVGAFEGCVRLYDVKIGAGVTSIARLAFYDCNVRKIEMAKCSVYSDVFTKNPNLRTVIFDGTERIFNDMYISSGDNGKFVNAQREYLQKDILVDENIENGSVIVYYKGRENYNGARPGGYGTFKVTPDAGYVLGSVTVTCGDTEVPTSLVEGTTDTYQFVMPDADVNVTAQFNAIDYFVQIFQKEGMTVTTNISDLSKVHVGDEVILTFTPDDPDEFDGIWHISVAKGPYFNGSYVNTEKISDYQYKFTMPAVDVKISFQYNTKNHAITRVAPYNEWYSSYPNKARSGEEVDLYFYVSGEYKTETSDLWVKNKETGEAIDFTFGPGLNNMGSECQKLTFTMPKADVEFCVSFKPQDILLSFPEDMHGVIGKFYVGGEETNVAHKGDTVTVVLDDTELSERYLLVTGNKKCDVWYKSSYDGTWHCYDSSYMTGNIAKATDNEHEYSAQVELKGYDPELKFTPQFANLYKSSIDPNITGGTVSLSADDEYFTKYELVYLEYELDDNEDRVFLGFEVTDADGGEVYVTDYYGDYYFSMPDKDVTVSAKFSVKHAVSLGDCTHGSLSFPNDLETVKMKSGDLVYVVAEPEEGYICTGVRAVDSEGETYDAMWFDPNYVSPIGPIKPKGSDGKAGSGGYIPDIGKGGGKDDGFLPIGPSVLGNPTYPDDDLIEEGNVWSFEMPDDVVTVTATFAQMSSLVFDIDLNALVNDGLGYEEENYAVWDGQSGSLILKAGDEDYSGETGASYGQTISLTIEAPEGYYIGPPYVAKKPLDESAVVGEDIDYMPSNIVYADEKHINVAGVTLTFTMPLSDVDISIFFMPIPEQDPEDP